MAIYKYSSLAAGTTTFDLVAPLPATLPAGHQPKFTISDFFVFDDPTISASSIAISEVSGTTTITVGGKTLTFTGFAMRQMSVSGFTFEDGSRLQIGDGTTAVAADDADISITGTEFNDYFDGLGNGANGDTINYASATSGVTITLGDGIIAGTTNGGAGVDKLFNIENAIGSIYSDILTARTDVGSRLDGGLGIDTLTGGAGNDTFVTTAGDVVTDGSTADQDLVMSSVDYVLPTNVENLTLTGTAVMGIGNAAVNIITGTSGKNILDGGAGADTLSGGAGDDTYLFGAGDTITELTNGGTDLVISSVTVTLADNVENLRLGSGAINGTGNASANLIYAGVGNNTLDGGTGLDTLSYQYGATAGVTVALNVATAQTTGGSGSDTISNFENLTGTRFSDTLTGTTAANTLIGGSGNDRLTGMGGNDVLDGGTGNDTYVVTTTTGVTFKDTLGVDTLEVSSGFGNISTFSFLENVTLTGTASNATGNAGANILQGNAGNNILDGGAGNDVLLGGLGSNTLKGGDGDDTYIVNPANTLGGSISDTTGKDLLIFNDAAAFTTTLPANIENFTAGTATVTNGVLGAITVSTVDATVTGNLLNNVITGGTGANTLNGGDGNDVLSVGYTIGTTTAVKNDRLDGGLGNDSMFGGRGNDTYVVDSTADVVTELGTPTGTAAQGNDTVESSITYTLSGNLENLTLTGTTAINGTGNASVNTIIGNDADNILSGGVGNDTLTGNAGNDRLDGGSGADGMTGGAGDDTYVVDKVGDTVAEAASEGTDLVLSSVTFTLGANVENLTLTGSSAVNGTGNADANVLTGNSGANTLVGNGGGDTFIGGAGKDTLTGGAGVDTFVYNAASESTVAFFDVITNFTAGTDTIDVSAIFGGAVPSTLITSGAFHGTGAPEVSYISGKVSFDVDGNGTADFAIALTGAPTIALTDFTF